MRAHVLAVVLLFGVGACGDDDDAPPPRPAAPRAPAAAKPAGPGGPLKPMRRAEDSVVCPTPTDAKKCDPKLALCGAGQFCIAAGKGHYCGPCPERAAIRHTFKPRDFQGSDLRDPFQSFVINQPGLGGTGDTALGMEKTEKCMRTDQMVATNYGYQTLKLVGIVSQGTQRKVLMMDPGGLGRIIKKGDCVGKEKAVVKDIGAGYITFVITPGPTPSGQREPEEHSMQLYPMQVSLGSQLEEARAQSAPIVAPPSQTTPQQTGNSVRIEEPPAPPAPTIAPPPQAPTQLRP